MDAKYILVEWKHTNRLSWRAFVWRYNQKRINDMSEDRGYFVQHMEAGVCWIFGELFLCALAQV